MLMLNLRHIILSVAVLCLLQGSGCQQIRKVSDMFAGKTPALYARQMENPNSPDLRWKGMNKLLENDFAKKPPYTTRYRQIAQSDPDPLVRAMALRALNRSRDAGATDLYIKALADKSELVRLEGAKALNNLPDPASIPALLALVNKAEESRDIRIAAAEALKHYKQLDVARALVARLNERDFGVAWQARRSLRRMTQNDLGYNEGAWLQYITGPEKPFG
jgi:hypothetical protein